MRKQKKAVALCEAMKNRWRKRIVFEKGYTEETAHWMAQRLEALIDYMQYGHAVVAYYKQNGEFRFVTATLIYYEENFHQKYDLARTKDIVVYWDVEQQGWRTFNIENFLEWKPFV